MRFLVARVKLNFFLFQSNGAHFGAKIVFESAENKVVIIYHDMSVLTVAEELLVCVTILAGFFIRF